MYKKLIIKKISENLIHSLIYFSLILFFIFLLFRDKLTFTVLLHETFIIDSNFPDTIGIIFVCSLLFILFTLFASITVAGKMQNYYKSALSIRIILFFINMLPIALFQHYFIKRFGFKIIYFFLIYIVINILLDIILKPVISAHSKKIKNNLLIIVIHEIIVISLSLFITGILNIKNITDMKAINLSIPSELLPYIFFIILFNSVTFFTIEFCINIFQNEYKKYYSKYFFIFNYSGVLKLLRILRNAMPQVLEKVKKSLTWLIFFILIVEFTFTYKNGIGKYLFSAYESGNPGVFLKYIFYIIFILCLINILIDIFAVIFSKKDETVIDIINYDNSNNILQNNLLDKAKNKNKILISGIIFIFLIINIPIFKCSQKYYPFAGYYDFSLNMEKTVQEFLHSKNIKPEQYPNEAIDKYNDKLCKMNEDYSFNIIELEIEKPNNEIVKYIPSYNSAFTTFFYIEDERNMINKAQINVNDKIISIKYITVLQKNILKNIFHDQLTSFRLTNNKAIENYTENKPFYLVLPYFYTYFITLVSVIILFTMLIYYIITYCIINNKNKLIYRVSGKCYEIIIRFLNSISLFTVFLLLNQILQKEAGSTGFSWINKTFFENLSNFIFIQIVIIIMFSDSFINEIKLNARNIFNTKEFEYYSLIGMNNKNKMYIYNKKYGCPLLLKLIFQNILFVININWFILYAFNYRKDILLDNYSITYSLSFENILSKIISHEEISTNGIYFLILILINLILITLYLFNQRKLERI